MLLARSKVRPDDKLRHLELAEYAIARPKLGRRCRRRSRFVQPRRVVVRGHAPLEFIVAEKDYDEARSVRWGAEPSYGELRFDFRVRLACNSVQLRNRIPFARATSLKKVNNRWFQAFKRN